MEISLQEKKKQQQLINSLKPNQTARIQLNIQTVVIKLTITMSQQPYFPPSLLNPELILSKGKLTEIKEEFSEEQNQIQEHFNQEERDENIKLNQYFLKFQDDEEIAAIRNLHQKPQLSISEELEDYKKLSILKKIKIDKQLLNPYKPIDNKRKSIHQELAINNCRQFHQFFLNIEDNNQSPIERIQQFRNKCQKFLYYKDKSIPFLFNNQMVQIIKKIDKATNQLEQADNIFLSSDNLEMSNFSHLDYFYANLSYQQLLIQLVNTSPTFNIKFKESTQEKILSQFALRVINNEFLPLNLNITINTIRCLDKKHFIQTNEFNDQLWTLQFEWRLGKQMIIFNPIKTKELANYLSIFKPYSLQLLNLHDEDPKKFRSVRNLGTIIIENQLKDMIVSDVGWIFNYEPKDIKRFSESIKLSIKSMNKEILFSFLENHILPISILSGVPLLKIGKNYASIGQDMMIRLNKPIKKEDIGKVLSSIEYLESHNLLNHPSQRMIAMIKPCFQINIDFYTKKFLICQESSTAFPIQGELRDFIMQDIKLI